jgi:hypothetical protein
MNKKERYDYILARLKEMVEENKVKSKSLTKNNKNEKTR